MRLAMIWLLQGPALWFASASYPPQDSLIAMYVQPLTKGVVASASRHRIHLLFIYVKASVHKHGPLWRARSTDGWPADSMDMRLCASGTFIETKLLLGFASLI